MGVNEPKRGSMFEAFTSRLNETLETAKNDFKSNLSKKFTVAATNLSTVGSGGGKTKLLWKVLEHSKASLSRLESKLEHIKSTEVNHDGISTGSVVTAQVDVSLVNNLLIDYKYLIEAFELMYVERTYLEEILVVESELESLDDLELVAQYYKGLHDSLAVSKNEVHRLMTKLAEMEDQREVIQAKNEHIQAQHVDSATSINSTTGSSSDMEKRISSLELSLKQTELLLEGIKAEKAALARQLQERTDELTFIKDNKQDRSRSQSLSHVPSTTPSPNLRIDQDGDYMKRLEQELFECKRELRRRSSMECTKPPVALNLPSPNHNDTALKGVMEEFEKIKLENLRLKNSNTSEYNRNLVLKFLQKPENRPEMLELIAKAFNLNDKDLKTIKL